MILALLTLPALAATLTDSTCDAWGDFSSIGAVEHPAVTELSGLAASQNNPEVLWGHNDSGGGTTLYAIGTDGADLGTFALKGAENIDWEDIALGPCGDGCACLYVADVGDHFGKRSDGSIWRVHEPDVDDMPTKVKAEEIAFVYPSGAYDAEALIVDPVNGDLFLITRTDGEPATVFAFPPGTPEGEADPVTLTEVATLDLVAMGAEDPRVTGASASPLGRRVVVRTDQDVYVYDVPEGGTIADVWDLDPERLEAPSDQDGEAIAWLPDGASFIISGEGATSDLWSVSCDDTDDESQGEALPLCEGEDGGCGCGAAPAGGAAWALALAALAWRRRAQSPRTHIHETPS